MVFEVSRRSGRPDARSGGGVGADGGAAPSLQERQKTLEDRLQASRARSGTRRTRRWGSAMAWPAMDLEC